MAQMTALRRRMIDDMTVHNLSPATQQSYVYAVAKFSRFFTRPLSRLRRPHDRNRRHPPCQHFRRCGSLEHLITPIQDPVTAQCPGPAPAVDPATLLLLPGAAHRQYPGNQPCKPRRPPAPLISRRPKATTTSRSRFTGASPRTSVATSPRPPARLNHHRP
jgi:hypothetical protein